MQKRKARRILGGLLCVLLLNENWAAQMSALSLRTWSTKVSKDEI
jgi:hypothetical protein